MSFDLVHIFSTMSPLSKAIFAILVLMAVLSIGVTVERWIAFRRSARESGLFARAATPLIDEWKIDEVEALAAKYKHSALAKLFFATIQRYIRAFEGLEGGLSPVELARNESERAKEALSAELRRGMSMVATIGSIAPFVGLLGTVVGIIAAFQGIGAAGSGGIASVSAGIAEALVETAFGLMVAIPAVVMFNYLTGRVAAIELAIARSVGELIDEMQTRDGVARESTTRSTRAAA
jgi:biopolymer transport protein ExbB